MAKRTSFLRQSAAHKNPMYSHIYVPAATRLPLLMVQNDFI